MTIDKNEIYTRRNVQHKEWWELEFAVIIFQFVNIKDNLTNISLVCKKWHYYSTNTVLYHSLKINTQMINSLNKSNTSLNRWRNIQNLNIYIGLDVNPFQAYNVLNALESQCKCSNIISISIHIFGFDGAEIINRLLRSVKKLLARNYKTLQRIRLEFGHGLTMSCWPNFLIFENVTHLIFDRISRFLLYPNRACAINSWAVTFPNVTHLSLNYAGLSEQDFIDFSQCKNIRYLSVFMLEHEWLTVGKTVQVLSLFPGLVGLQLEYPRFEPPIQFFQDLAISLPSIQVLYFWWWSIVEDHYDVILKSFSELKQAAFAYSSISTHFIENHPLTPNIEKIGLYGNLLNVTMNDNNIRRPLAQQYIANADNIASLFN